MSTCACTYTCTCIYIFTVICMHRHIERYSHIHPDMHAFRYVHAHMHVNTHFENCGRQDAYSDMSRALHTYHSGAVEYALAAHSEGDTQAALRSWTLIHRLQPGYILPNTVVHDLHENPRGVSLYILFKSTRLRIQRDTLSFSSIRARIYMYVCMHQRSYAS